MADAETAPRFEFIFAAHVLIDQPLDFGDIGKGGRRIVPIVGGEFSGPRMRGKVLPGGADWQILRNDGVSELEARYTLRTDDGALIHVRNLALRHGPPQVHGRARRRPPCRSRNLLLPRRHVFRNRRCALCLDRQIHRRQQRRTPTERGQAKVLSAAVTAQRVF